MLYERSDDYRPLFWVQGRPIYVNTLLIAFHITAFVVSALCIAYFGFSTVVYALAISTTAIWQGEVWRLFSYVAFDPDFFSQRSLWFLWNMLLLFFFGREVEQFVGWKIYLSLYASLVVIPAMLLCLWGLFIPQIYLNCCDVFFGIFVAFATIYPGVLPISWFPITTRVFMWILLGVSTLISLAAHNYTAIFMLWACSAVAYVVMRLAGAGHGMNWLTDWLDERRAQKLARRNNIKLVQDKKADESIDAILEKISKHGVGSLSAKERTTLERARANLLKRDQR